MTQLSYERLLRMRLAYLRRNKASQICANTLKEVLALNHPEREFAFVALSRLLLNDEKRKVTSLPVTEPAYYREL